MRAVGEKNISSLAQTKRLPKSIRDEWSDVVCKECEKEGRLPALKLKYYKHGYICKECRDKAKLDTANAMLAVARRKLALKNKKR